MIIYFAKIIVFIYELFSELSKDTTFFLQFKNKELETTYSMHREPLSSLPLFASILVHFVSAIYSSIILQSSAVHFIIILSPILLLLPIVWISVAESFPKVYLIDPINVFIYSTNINSLVNIKIND